MLCRLGKRKASERTDEASQEPRHSKRAAVDTAVPGNAAATAAEHSGTQSTGSLQDATIRGQGVDTRGHKRTAETQSASDYQGVATHSGIRQPEAKRPAPSFNEQSGESHIPHRATSRRNQAASPMTIFALMQNLLCSLFRCCVKAYCEQALPSCQGALHSTPDSCRAGKPECTAKQEEETAPCAVCRYKASVQRTCSINICCQSHHSGCTDLGRSAQSQRSMSSLLPHPYVMQHKGKALCQTDSSHVKVKLDCYSFASVQVFVSCFLIYCP